MHVNILEDQSPNLILRQGTINPMYNENISTVARYPNPNLKWEETRQFNVELDLSFLDNRIGINGTLYLKKTEDCLSLHADSRKSISLRYYLFRS